MMGWESKVEPVLYAGLSAGALLGGVVGCGALFAEQAVKARAASVRAAHMESEAVEERAAHIEMVRQVLEPGARERTDMERELMSMRRHPCVCGHDAVFHTDGGGCSSCGCMVSREYVIRHQGDHGAPLVQDVVGGGNDTPSDAPIPESAQQMMREWADYKDNADRLTDDEVLRCTKLMGRGSIWWWPCGCGHEATYHRVAAQTGGEG